MLGDERGVTLIELLTVVVLIGLLTGIAVPAHFNQRDRARDAAAQAGARAAQTAAIEIGQENGGRFNGPDGVTVVNLLERDESLEDVHLKVPLALADTYTVRVHSDTGNSFDITQGNDGSVDLTCASADAAGCSADGTWD